MFNIAICDDEIKICSQIEGYLEIVQKKLNIKINIQLYYNEEVLIDELLNGLSYNLIFLDIELITTDGINVGNIIRGRLNDEFTQIAYISGNSNYALQLFDTNPINFLVKPLKYEDIEKVIIRFLKLNNVWSETFTYKTYQDIHNIRISNIMYFKRNRRQIHIYFYDDFNDVFYGSFDKICSQLKKNQFILTHKSYLVNYKYIKEFHTNSVILINGDIIPISQSQRKSVKEQFLEIELRSL